MPNPISEPKSKKRKGDSDIIHTTNPHISVEKPDLKVMQSNFLMCVNCWDLLYSTENLHRGKASVFKNKHSLILGKK